MNVNKLPYLPPEAASAIAAAATAIPGVAEMYRGVAGELALLYPRLRVPGLAVTGAVLEVHVVVEIDTRRPRLLTDVVALVRAASAEVLGHYPDCGINQVRAIASDAVPARKELARHD